MEKQVDRKVYLELVVKVMEKWRKDKNKLKKLGYG
jgi:GTP-binding protein Era